MATAADDLIAEATPWIDEALAECGRERNGPVVVQRDRPWAIVASLLTTDGDVWFKANHEAFRYEAAALELVDDAAPHTVLSPLARHTERGWFLAEDGGPTADQAPELAPEATQIVEVYLRAQQASVGLIAELSSVGVPSHDAASLLDVFDRASAHPLAGTAGGRIKPMRGQVETVIAQLGGADPVITNSDLKPSHVFVGPPTLLFDWGDAVLAHPMLSCGTILRGFGAEGLDHYVAGWGESPDSPAVQAGLALVDLINLDVWLRDPAAALDRHPGQIEKLLNQLADKLA